MFGRSASARIKAASEALANGRLDEAFEVALAVDSTDGEAGRGLLADVAEALLRRGQERLLEKRFAGALADFERAGKCGQAAEKVAQWRQRALEAMADDHKARQQKLAALGGARERLAAGDISGAAEAVAVIPTEDADRVAAAEKIEAQTRRAEQALASARLALKNGDMARAVDELATARTLHRRLSGVAELETELGDKVLRQTFEDLRAGRVDRAAQEENLLDRLGGAKGPERLEARQALQLIRDAAEAVGQGRYAKAGVLLGRLRHVLREAEWVDEARKHLDALDGNRRALLEGPLGVMAGPNVPSAVGAESRPFGAPPALTQTGPAPQARAWAIGGREGGANRAAEAAVAGLVHVGDLAAPADAGRMDGAPVVPVIAMPAGDGAGDAGNLPRRLLLRIDGVGSFLLLRGDRVSIGRGGAGATADVQLVSDLAEKQAEIIRAGEDYFIMGGSGVELAGRRVDYALLQHDDRVRLGKRVRLRFLRPSRKSTTAVLALGDGVRMAADCRRVILWGGPLILGGTANCHIKLGPTMASVILMERRGALFLKSVGSSEAMAPLSLGVQTRLGELQFSIQEWAEPRPGGRVVG